MAAIVPVKMAATLAFSRRAPHIANNVPTLAKSPFARYLHRSITFSAA